jgi:glycosyl hydrolase family 76
MDDDFRAQIGKAMARSINFLLSPLSIDLNENSKAYGGFYGLVSVNKNDDEPFIFSEITAYSVRILLKLYSWTREERYRDIAILAGNWLLTAQYRGEDANAHGAFYDKFYTRSGTFDDAFYVYPNATCIGALADLYELTNGSKYLDAAKSCLKWLLGVMPHNVGNKCIGFKESYGLSKREFSGKVYPYESICVPYIILEHDKSLGLSEEQKAMMSSAIKWALESLDEGGYFPFFYSIDNGKFNRTAYTHFTIYPFYNLMGYPLLDLHRKGFGNCLETAKRLAEWAIRAQDADGGFYTYYFKGQHSWHKQSPATAQVACALMQLWHEVKDERYRRSAFAAAKWLVDNQIKEDPNAGGFYWIYPNKSLKPFSKQIIRAKEKLKLKIDKESESEYLENYSGFLGRLPIWTVQFAIEALYRVKDVQQSA